MSGSLVDTELDSLTDELGFIEGFSPEWSRELRAVPEYFGHDKRAQATSS